MQAALSDARALLQQCGAFHARHSLQARPPAGAAAAWPAAQRPRAAAAAAAAAPREAAPGREERAAGKGSAQAAEPAAVPSPQPGPGSGGGAGGPAPGEASAAGAAATAAAAAAAAAARARLMSGAPSRASAALQRPVRPQQAAEGGGGGGGQKRVLTWRSTAGAATEQAGSAPAAAALHPRPGGGAGGGGFAGAPELAPAAQQGPRLVAPPPEPATGGGRAGPTPGYVASPVFSAARGTRPLALAGALAAAAEVHDHLLLFAAGADATNAAVKALATARRFVRAASGGGRELLVQPTLRGRAPGGADALAFDVFVAPAPLALPPGATAPGNRTVRVTAGAFEADWARNLASNMPRRGQTVMKVAGAYAVENAVKSVALARGVLQRGRGEDFLFVPMWCGDAGFSPPRPRGRRRASGDGGEEVSGGGEGGEEGGEGGGGEEGGGGGEGDGGGGEAATRGGAAVRALRPKLRLAVMRCREGQPLQLLGVPAPHAAPE